ncbi:MAG: class I SAM-dependent methyltransferase [Sphingobacteriales bacterium]|nr:class I SAM-dependent methyltransferase [Sphingobacteriales bacterium]
MKKRERTGERWEPLAHNETAIEHLHRYALACEFSNGKSVLDIACGEGYGSRLLSHNAASVTGVDIDPATIEIAKEKYGDNKICFLTADAKDTQLPRQSFDLVVSFETLEHLDEHELLMKEFKRVLKPGGLLIISTPDKTEYSEKTGHRNPFHKKELSKEQFESLLQKHFRHYHLFYQKSFQASLIRNQEQYRYDIYSGDHLQVKKNSIVAGVYMIAIASDLELPGTNNSIFDGQSIFQAALDEQESRFTKAFAYRFGHALLKPAKWLKKLF